MNAARHGLDGRIEFIASDLFEEINGKFDTIVSNPPYIAKYEFDTLPGEVLKEPRIALDGGDDGLDFYRNIIKEAHNYLNPGGQILFEVGFGQAGEVKKIIENCGFEVLKVRKDWNGIDRVIVSRHCERT